MSSEGIGELKGCPFCGGKCSVWRYLDRGFNRARIVCDGCGVQGPSTTEANVADIIAVWNTRALVAQEAEIAALTELLAQADSFLEAERSLVAKLDGEIAALRTALAKLANEVAGLKATEFKVRNVIGDTNWNVLMLRETEARATLAEEKNDGQ